MSDSNEQRLSTCGMLLGSLELNMPASAKNCDNLFGNLEPALPVLASTTAHSRAQHVDLVQTADG